LYLIFYPALLLQADLPPQVAAEAIVADIQQQQAIQVNQMVAALRRLGLSEVAAHEFTDNGITNMNRLRTLTENALDCLIKQIHRDNRCRTLHSFCVSAAPACHTLLGKPHAYHR